jgi:hypothetical protein
MGKLILLGLLMFISLSVIPMADASPAPSEPPICYYWRLYLDGNHIVENISLKRQYKVSLCMS